MAFDTLAAPTPALNAEMSTAALIEASGELCPVWTAANPDRALALLFVAPHDGLAIDVLTAN